MSQLPAWDNSTEYKGIGTADFNQDVEKVQDLLKQIEKSNQDFNAAQVTEEQKISLLQKISVLQDQALILIANLSTFVSCEKSLDAKNELAQKFKAQIQELWSRFEVASTASSLFLQRCDEKTLQAYLQSEHTSHEAFHWRMQRTRRDFSLSEDEEKTLAQFERFGRDAWGELYTSIGGSLEVHMPSKGVVGVAEAAGYIKGGDATLRKEAWQGTQAAWKTVEVSCAAVLNNIAGYRHEEYRKRSYAKKMHFMDIPLFQSRIEEKTLNTMMQVLQENISIGRRGLKAMGKVLGVQRIEPWDLMASSPRQKGGAQVPFSEALAMISQSFGSVDPKMGEFVTMMADKHWIDARVLPNKAPGAFCTGFAKSKTPRVFQSYMGTMKDVSTLAHELGHAYHSWVMRDMPLAETHYPMTLAETASIFSETLLSEQLWAKADKEAQFNIAWEDAGDAVAFLINIPARFEFERSFYEARQNGPLSPKELGALTDQAWKKWFGDGITQAEIQYWMTKLHFSIAGVSFYNFPYTFGYLFGLGIYAQREKKGKDFHQAYVNILRDTGRMTAEELIQKHLGMDIREPQFWLDSLKIVDRKVAQLEALL